MVPLAAFIKENHSHARRRSVSHNSPSTNSPHPAPSLGEHRHPGATSGLPALASSQSVALIPGISSQIPPMSLSRSPSPQRGGGWSTPGLTDASDYDTPRRRDHGDMNGSAPNDLDWAAAKARSQRVRNTPSFTTRNEGFFSRQKRKISATLPRFNNFNSDQKDWKAEKLGRGRWRPAGDGTWSRLRTLVGNILRKFKILVVTMLVIALTTVLWSKSSRCLKRRQW